MVMCPPGAVELGPDQLTAVLELVDPPGGREGGDDVESATALRDGVHHPEIGHARTRVGHGDAQDVGVTGELEGTATGYVLDGVGHQLADQQLGGGHERVQVPLAEQLRDEGPGHRHRERVARQVEPRRQRCRSEGVGDRTHQVCDPPTGRGWLLLVGRPGVQDHPGLGSHPPYRSEDAVPHRLRQPDVHDQDSGLEPLRRRDRLPRGVHLVDHLQSGACRQGLAQGDRLGVLGVHEQDACGRCAGVGHPPRPARRSSRRRPRRCRRPARSRGE